MKCDVKYTVQLLESNALQMIFSNLTFTKFMSYICSRHTILHNTKYTITQLRGEIINFTEIRKNAIMHHWLRGWTVMRVYTFLRPHLSSCTYVFLTRSNVKNKLII